MVREIDRARPDVVSGNDHQRHTTRNDHAVSTPPGTGELTNGRPYYGESSTFNFLEKVFTPDSDETDSPVQTAADSPTITASFAASHPLLNSRNELLGNGTDDPLGLPQRSVADRMVECYFKFRHPLHPYLHEHLFYPRYERIWLRQEGSEENALDINMGWLALVNMVFAFGHDNEPYGANRHRGGTLYFKRAQVLVFSASLHPTTIELVQALLIMSHYLHNRLDLNNSWTMLGLATRAAQQLGLHLSVGSDTSSIAEQEIRKRTWWGCFVLDRLLSAKVGRHPTIDESEDSADLPLAVDDAHFPIENCIIAPATQPSQVPSYLDFFLHAIAQARVLGRIVETLYGSRRRTVRNGTPNERESNIPHELLADAIRLDGDLAAWQSRLPPHLQFDSTFESPVFERQRNVLLMRYYILLYFKFCC